MQLARRLLVILSLTARSDAADLHPAKTRSRAAKVGRIAYPPVSSSYSMLCFVGVRRRAHGLSKTPLDGGC